MRYKRIILAASIISIMGVIAFLAPQFLLKKEIKKTDIAAPAAVQTAHTQADSNVPPASEKNKKIIGIELGNEKKSEARISQQKPIKQLFGIASAIGKDSIVVKEMAFADSVSYSFSGRSKTLQINKETVIVERNLLKDKPIKRSLQDVRTGSLIVVEGVNEKELKQETLAPGAVVFSLQNPYTEKN